MTKMVRKQLFITEEQNRKLKERAAASGVPEAELIRAGIDLKLEGKGTEGRLAQPGRELLKLLGRARRSRRGNARDPPKLEPARSDEARTPTGA